MSAPLISTFPLSFSSFTEQMTLAKPLLEGTAGAAAFLALVRLWCDPKGWHLPKGPFP